MCSILLFSVLWFCVFKHYESAFNVLWNYYNCVVKLFSSNCELLQFIFELVFQEFVNLFSMHCESVLMVKWSYFQQIVNYYNFTWTRFKHCEFVSTALWICFNYQVMLFQKIVNYCIVMWTCLQALWICFHFIVNRF